MVGYRCSQQSLSSSTFHCLCLRRHSQPLRARPWAARYSIGHAPIIKLARRRHRGRPSRPARPAQQFHGVLLDEAKLPRQRGSSGDQDGGSTTNDGRSSTNTQVPAYRAFPIPRTVPLACSPARSAGQDYDASLPDAIGAPAATPTAEQSGRGTRAQARSAPGPDGRPQEELELALLPALPACFRSLRCTGDNLPTLPSPRGFCRSSWGNKSLKANSKRRGLSSTARRPSPNLRGTGRTLSPASL